MVFRRLCRSGRAARRRSVIGVTPSNVTAILHVVSFVCTLGIASDWAVFVAGAVGPTGAVVTPEGDVVTIGSSTADDEGGSSVPNVADRLDGPLRLIEVSTPSHRQSFETSEVDIKTSVRSDIPSTSLAPTDVCITQAADPSCFGYRDGDGGDASSEAARTIVARARESSDLGGPPQRHCFPLPFSGRIKIPATCHLFGIEAVHRSSRGGKMEEAVLESSIRAVRVDTVDSFLFFLYPTLPARHEWGKVGVITESVRRMGPGLVLEFGTGEYTTPLLSKYLTHLREKHANQKGAAPRGLTLSDGVVHTFDSFRGLPEPWRPGFGAGHWRSSRYMEGKPDFEVPPNAVVHAGMVQDTLGPFLSSPEAADAPLGLIHLDFTVHSSTLFVLDAIACRLSEGTIVVFHEFFNYFDWTDTKGERTAWNEAVEKHGIEYEEIGYSSTMYMVEVTGVPTNCRASAAGSGGESLVAGEAVGGAAPIASQPAAPVLIDPAVRERSKAALTAARERHAKGGCNGDGDDDAFAAAVERIVAIDPFYAEALGFLAHALVDPARTSERMDYARRALLLQHAPPIAVDGAGDGAGHLDAAALLSSLHKTPAFEKPFDRRLMKHRLRHDLEQFRYIKSKRRVPEESFLVEAIRAYNATLDELRDKPDGAAVTLTWAQWKRIGPYFNRALYIPAAPRSRIAEGGVGSLNTSAVNFDSVISEYKTDSRNVVVVDDVLSDSTLKTLLRYYREATVFYGVGHPSYVGSYLPDGLGNPALAQVVEEISHKLRPIICDRPLVQAWVYKYDERIPRGINIHADVAAVNINIWLSPNESIDDGNGKTGGLVIYTRKPPDDWDFARFNSDPTPKEVTDMLAESGWANITVPYRQNRMVLFDSKLFHLSDVGRWREGYERRRINLTLLFGRMGSSCELE